MEAAAGQVDATLAAAVRDSEAYRQHPARYPDVDKLGKRNNAPQ